VVALESGRRIVVSLRDGTTVEGTYRGVADVPAAEYARRYAQVHGPDGRALPKLGPGLRVTAASGEELQRVFLGVEPRGLRLGLPKGRASAHMEFARATRVVDADGQAAEGSELERLAGAGQLPILTEILLDTPKGGARVRFEDVLQVEVPPRTGGGEGKVLGILVLVGVLVTVIALVAGSSSKPPPTTDTLRVCSPLVSSFDGQGYVPDADAFGGAMFEAAKRTDWDTLEHLREIGGRYRLRITKGHAETEYVDELALLAVDHPPHTRVVPDYFGRLHLLGALRPPLRAVAADGSDVTALVSQRDDRSWVSNPFGRDAADRAQARDGMTLEFARPGGARAATLALRVQNTDWGYFVRHEFLELLGRDFDRWYAQMGSSPADFAAFEKARQREVALNVQVETRGGWKDAGFVWEVGPALPREVAVLLDLGDVPGDRVRVRVDSTVGLWTIDSAGIDYSGGSPLQVRELTASRVTDQDGRDVTASLARADGDDYVMSGETAWAEATFLAPPQHAGRSRSLVLKTTGHYRIHVAGTGEPLWALVRRMVDEPGAFGQYTLQLLNGYERRFFEQRAGAE
jgi:hypothetical protein